MKIGINGFGRIGRAIVRKALESQGIEVAVINELDSNLENLAYLLAFDTIYGRLDNIVSAEGGTLNIDDHCIPVFHRENLEEVPWQKFGVDVLIEATGVAKNVVSCRRLLDSGHLTRVVVTNASQNVDKTILIGVNCHTFEPREHPIVSSSICDANAILPILNILEQHWGIESAFITTLHPLLAYQNVTDGTLNSISNPGHSWTDFSLGRATYNNLIPKDTTAGTACLTVLPALKGRLDAISFRVPTQIVAASDFSVNVREPISVESFHAKVETLATAFPNVVALEQRPLVSSDHKGMDQSCIVDGRRTKVIGEHFVKIVSWYDNEWGYSCRVLDVAKLIG